MHNLVWRSAIFACSALALVALFPRTAAAQDRSPVRPLGGQGSLAISVGADVTLATPAGKDASSAAPPAYTLSPAADYFATKNLSLGGAWIMSGFGAGRDSTSVIGAGPRVGYLVVMGRDVSLWLRASVDYTRTTANGSMSNGARPDTDRLVIELAAPVAVHVAREFFLAAGPWVSTDLVARAADANVPRQTSTGVSVAAGAWL